MIRNLTNRKLSLSCPNCNKALRGIEPYNVATKVVRRKCSRVYCRTQWQITIVPRLTTSDGLGRYAVDYVTFTEVR